MRFFLINQLVVNSKKIGGKALQGKTKRIEKRQRRVWRFRLFRVFRFFPFTFAIFFFFFFQNMAS